MKLLVQTCANLLKKARIGWAFVRNFKQLWATFNNDVLLSCQFVCFTTNDSNSFFSLFTVPLHSLKYNSQREYHVKNRYVGLHPTQTQSGRCCYYRYCKTVHPSIARKIASTREHLPNSEQNSWSWEIVTDDPITIWEAFWWIYIQQTI